MELKNKVIVVTGASDGLGRSIALRLAKYGCGLALIARDQKKLEDVESECLSFGSPKCMIYSCDIRQIEEIKKTTQKIISDFQNVSVLVNSAGIWQKVAELETISDQIIDDVIDTNLTGLITFTKYLLPNLKNQKEAAIVNISSRAGYQAQAGRAIYGASKWGVRGFTEVLKQDLKESSVRVTGIYQGGMNTKMFEKMGEEMNISAYTEPDDIAEIIEFLLTRPNKCWMHEVRIDRK